MCNLLSDGVWNDLPKCPRILAPHKIELCGHGEDQGAQVQDGQVEEVDVGGRPHVLVLDDHQACGQVAQHTQHKEDAAMIHNYLLQPYHQ